MQTIYTFLQARTGKIAFPHFKCNLCGCSHYLAAPLDTKCENCKQPFILKEPRVIADAKARLNLHHQK